MRRRPVAVLIALVLWPGLAWADEVTFAGRASWPSDFGPGGWSAIEVSDDGSRFVAVSDRGWVATGGLARDNGTLIAIHPETLDQLIDRDGDSMSKRKADSEGLALDASGGLNISFEGVGRVWRYGQPGARPTARPRPDAFRHLQPNSGLEALAIDPQGRLVAIPERSGLLARPFPAYRLENGTWRIAFQIPRHGEPLPAGADFDAGGALYLLERHFGGIIGFATRVRRFRLDDNGILSEETLLETRLGRHGNLEGIAVWPGPDGCEMLTMIADDNQRFLQRSEIVEYRVCS